MSQFLVTFRDGIATPPTAERVREVLTNHSSARYMERAVLNVEPFERQEPKDKVSLTPWKVKRYGGTIAQFMTVDAAAEYVSASDDDLPGLSIVFELTTI